MNKIVYSVGYMFVIALFFTSLVSIVKLTNEDKIEKNQQIKLQKTILKVLGIAIKERSSPENLIRIYNNRIETIKIKDRDFYLGYDEDGKTIKGYAFPVEGAGFWGPIQTMVAVDANASSIIGIAFYKHSETPGLGARISEDWFTEQFSGINLSPIEDNKQFFYLTPSKSGKASNNLDAITGASRTSDAVEIFLNNELDLFLKEFWNSLTKG
ncbi:FMN-binding protein [Thermodesulfobacteriota bacterium]